MIKRHDCFIGRFVTFHKGHLHIIKKVWNKNKRPILILIMDTEEETRATERKYTIEVALQGEGIEANIQIIPPIFSVNYGRKVGYEINYIDAPPEVKEISGTQIREEKSL